MALVERAGTTAALLSAVEVGLGSLLHGFRVPLTGHLLSLNQSFFLARAVRDAREEAGARILPAWISSIVSMLKSLAPAGKKLTPMLAIGMQGLLFSIGTVLFGPNLVGVVVGAILASVWAFVQPIVLYVIAFGATWAALVPELQERAQKDFGFLSEHVEEKIVLVLTVAAAVKALMAIAATIIAWTLPPGRLARYQARMIALSRARAPRAPVSASTPLRGALRDLAHPLYLASALLVAAFLIWLESPWTQVVWGVLRPLAIAFFMFWVIRSVDWSARLPWLRRRLGDRYADSFLLATERLKNL